MADYGLVSTSTFAPESTVPGTKAWAESVVSNAKAYARFAEDDVRPLVERYQALCEHKVWETWFPDEPRTLARFCREVLGYEDEFLETMSVGVAALDREGFSGSVSVRAALDAARLQARAREAKAQAVEAEVAIDLPGRGGDRRSLKFQSDNVTLKLQRGNSESYALRRLKRDHPELHRQVESGATTTGAAAVKAKIRRPTTSVRVDDIESAARTLRRHYQDPEQRALLAKLLTEKEN